MAESNLLGEFLRTSRERVHPDQVGIVTSGHRRVPGLRREEVAMLAGISSEYYLRLEQGRDRNPSISVVDGLTRALLLDTVEAAHLRELALSHTPAPSSSPVVADSIRRLLDALDLPAFVQDRHYDVLATNRLAQALLPGTAVGANRVVSTFLHPAERHLFPDREEVISEIVASFRVTVAAFVDDDRTRELITELSAASPEFRRLWARYALESRVDRPPMRFDHPLVGELVVTRENLEVDGRDGQRLMIFHAERGSESWHKLRQLAAATGALRESDDQA